MERGQVLVRANVGKAKVTADVLDLDQASFNTFVLGALMKLGAVHGSSRNAEEAVQRADYHVREECWTRYSDQIK